MSDSVDRVFSHALSTVNKIQTGPEKPPAAIRLKLYGLYKQSMEGNVEGIMERPTGRDEAAKQAREKWDAWKSSTGLSRTEAKRRYITTLIEAMHKYASQSPDARELVTELEFVWDQVKSNVPSSASSSPNQTHAMSASLIGLESPSHTYFSRRDSKAENGDKNPMRILRPMSQEQEDEEEKEEKEHDEFVDAQDSQLAEPVPQNLTPRISESPSGPARVDSPTSTPSKNRKAQTAADAEFRWRRRMEAAMVKMTAEIAALREQLEARRLWARSRRGRVVNWLWNTFVAAAKHFAIDVLIFGLLMLWLRRKGDGRLEGAARVLLGDAVAQVQRVGTGVQREVQRGVGKVGRALVAGGSGHRRGGNNSS